MQNQGAFQATKYHNMPEYRFHDHGSCGQTDVRLELDDSMTTFKLRWYQAWMEIPHSYDLHFEGKCTPLGGGLWCLRGHDMLLHLVILSSWAKVSLDFNDPNCHENWAMDAAILDGSGDPEVILAMLIDPNCIPSKTRFPQQVVYFRGETACERECSFCETLKS